MTLSRGVGVRGYSPSGAEQPTLVISVHPLAASGPEVGALLRWRAHTSGIRLPTGDALAQFKTCNKLAQVMARAEAQTAGADEALLMNTEGHVVEAASGNLFWIQAGSVCTVPLDGGILRGITRGVILELSAQLGIGFGEANVQPAELRAMDAVFLSLSSHGVVELSEIDRTPLRRSPLVMKLFEAYSALLREECA